MNGKKIITAALAGITAWSFAFAAPVTQAAGIDSHKNKIDSKIEQEAEKTGTVIDAITEINDRGLDMEQPSTNTEADIAALSEKAQAFYELAVEEMQKPHAEAATEEDVLDFIGESSDKLAGTESTYLPSYSVGEVKKYYLSNQDVKDITIGVDWNSSFWSIATGVALIFAKNPTWITGLAVALPMLGATGLKQCNRLGKGIVITDYRVGATHNVTCESQ